LKIPKGDNQKLQIDEEQTTQWPKEKVQTFLGFVGSTPKCRKYSIGPIIGCHI
jgi:hypothetical protein